MKKVNFEVKSKDQAMDIAVDLLNLSSDKIDLEIVEEKKGVLGFSKSYTYEASCNVEPADAGYQLLKEMFNTMEIDAAIEMKVRNENEITYTINTSENPVLIGKAGKTLESLQFYVRSIVNSYSDERLMVQLDIGGYKENRRRQLEILATKTGKEVARTRIAAKLDSMNAYERRIVHTKLSDWRDVETISEGETPNRYVVIKPKSK